MCACTITQNIPPPTKCKMVKCKIVKSFCTLQFAFYILTCTIFYWFLFSQQAFSEGTKTKGFLKSTSAFIENKGQIIDQKNNPNPGVLYLLNTPGFNVQLRRDGFSYDVYSVEYKPNPHPLISTNHNSVNTKHHSDSLFKEYQFHRIDITLEGTNPECQIIPSNPLTEYFNYFTASAHPEGIRNVRQYSKIIYKNIYPDIDLEFFTNEEHGYKYNFVIRPGGNINDIRLTIAGPDYISLMQGTLKFGTVFGDVEELIPESYYLVNDSKIDIKAHFRKTNSEVYGFSVDRTIPENSVLIIDPTSIRLWGTYYGGLNSDYATSSTVDQKGNVFLCGVTQSTDNIATDSAYQSTKIGLGDKGFLVKFNSDGVRQWGTYFCGDILGGERVEACVADLNGNIYIDGITTSDSGIATPGAFQTIYTGTPWNAFLAKFNTNGELLWSTYYGGNGDAEIGGTWGASPGALAADRSGNTFIAGKTTADSGIATPGTYESNYCTDCGAAGFIAKFDSNGVRQWGTYYYGVGDFATLFTRCTTDSAGNLYVIGQTNDTVGIASPSAYQQNYGGGQGDAFVAAFNPSGQRLWATYYGGSLWDEGDDISSDQNGYIYIAGTTKSTTGIASPGCFQQSYGGGPYDGFIAKFSNSGQRIWGTYYGGSQSDYMTAIASDLHGKIFFCGSTNSPTGISTLNSYQPSLAGNYDSYFVKFDSTGQRIWGSYFGGGSYDNANSINYELEDTIYLAGYTTSIDNISTPNGHQVNIGGGTDAFLEKFIDCWPIDTAGPITGPVNVCKPSNGISYSIPSLTHAVNYIWTLPAGFTLTSGVGTPSIIVDISNSAISGTIGVQALNKCDSGATAYLYVTVNQAPVPVISGPNNTCAGPGKVYSTASGKSNYQWSVSAGGVITSGGSTTDNTVTVTWNAAGTQHVYVNFTDANGCSADSPTDYNVTVTPSPAVNITITATSNNVCEGTQVTFNSTASNGGGNPFYQWQVNGINIGASSPSFSYTPLNNDLVRCILTSSITGCIMNNPDTSNVITMIVNPILAVSLSISASSNPFCQDSTVTFTAIPMNEGTTPLYQWKVNGGNVGLSSPVYSFVPNNGDVVSCVLNSSIPCPIGNPATSNAITMVENTNVVVSVTISPSANPVCSGTSVTFQATPVNGGTTPVYQWKVNGIIVGTNNPIYSYTPVNGDVINCILTSNALCASGNPATSNVVTMIVNPLNPVTVTISSSANPVCSGTIVIYTALPINGGTLPVYQWKVNGLIVGTNNPIYSYPPVNGDIVNCVLTSNILCPTGNPATSNTITMTVNPNLPVSVVISASANPFCQGSSVTFTATPTNGGTLPSYQWKVNGINVGPNNPVYSYSPNNGDVVSCVMTSNIACPVGNPATSNSITMVVNANLPAGITISASTNPFCPGNSVTFTATPVNGGANPAYQWKVNGINKGTNSPTYTYNPASGDLVSCILTSNLACVTGNPATSNTIIMSGTLVSVVTFTACFDTITTNSAQPLKLKGGIPLGGTYSGPGVNSLTGIFTPSTAGIGLKILSYTYTNAALCSASATHAISIVAAPVFACGNNITDVRDNKVYPTVQIGSQCWMAANLDYGTLIPGNTSQRDNCIWEKYCYNDAVANCGQQTYYQWDEVMQYDETVSTQGMCPPGWHVPTEADWNTLFANYISNGFAGSPLKYSGFSGFNAILSGARYLNKNWDYQGFATFFWSSTAHGTLKAWAHGMNDPNPSVSVYPAFKTDAFSVRCLKD